jgi:hypothetical protein
VRVGRVRHQRAFAWLSHAYVSKSGDDDGGGDGTHAKRRRPHYMFEPTQCMQPRCSPVFRLNQHKLTT